MGTALGGVGSQALALGQRLLTLTTVAGVALFALIKQTVDAGDALAKNADRVGLSVDAYAQLSFVAGRAGISQDEFTTSLDFFNKSLGQAKAGTGGLLEFLKKVSPTLGRQVVAAKSTEEALDLMFSALDKLKDPSKRAAFAVAAFGRAGAKMGAMVQNGRGEISELRAEYARIAGSQEKFARQSEILNDAMGDAEAAFLGVKVAIATEFFPALIELTGVLKEFLIANRAGLSKWARETAAAFGEWVRGGGIQRLTEGFREFFKTISPIVERLGGWPAVLGGLAAAILGGPLVGALFSLAAAFGAVGVAMLATPLGWALALLALVAGAAAFALAKDEALAIAQQKRTKALGEQRIALDNVTFAQEQLNAAMKSEAAGPAQLEWLADQLALAKKEAAVATTNASRAVHDPGSLPLGVASLLLGGLGGPAGAAAARPPIAPKPGTENKLVVEMSNLPKGTRVRAEGEGEIDLSLGYALQQ
jgi:hypothetical protein